MDLTLLSGVVRNRKQMASAVSRSQALFDEAQSETQVPHNTIDRLRTYLSKNNLFRKFNLRVHKFTFQWELAIHLLVCILSLTPFFFTGRRLYSLVPISVWLFYNVLFLLGPQHSNKVIPRFGKLKNSFQSTIGEFFSPKLLPVLSISFLCVVLSLAVTGHRLGGPPLCYQPCGVCLATWKHSVPLPVVVASAVGRVDPYSAQREPARIEPLPPVSPLASPATLYDPLLGRVDPVVDAYRVGCGYANGKEMLGYYTMAQTSFILFFIVLVAITVCLAWRVAEEEKAERRSAEEWLKRENVVAFQLRHQLIEKFGSPGSSVRPEGSAVWVYFGVTAALTFTLLGWHNWYVLPPSNTATLLIILNLLTILMSTLILHLSFFGRLLALYKRNFHRVECLTKLLGDTQKENIDSWWNCRNFVLNDDLSLDYDIGGLAVSATFLIALILFGALITQLCREGMQAMLEPPGSYLAYACMYITCCLIKLFTLATNTYEEQHRHIASLAALSNSLYHQSAMSTDYNEFLEYRGMGRSTGATPWLAHAHSSEDDYQGLQDDGPLLIEDDFDLVKPSSQAQQRNNSASSGGNGANNAASTGGIAMGNLGTLGNAGDNGGSNSGNNSGQNSPGGDRPALLRTSSGNSPRKTRNKTAFNTNMNSVLSTNSGDHGDNNNNSNNSNNSNNMPEKSPTGILKNPSSGLINNWLGKTIFGSFRVGFEDAAGLEEGGENEGLLQNAGNSSESVTFEVNGPGEGGGAGLPRPHNTGKGFDASGAPLSIEIGAADTDSTHLASSLTATTAGNTAAGNDHHNQHNHNHNQGTVPGPPIGSTNPIVKLSPFGTTNKLFFPTSVQPTTMSYAAAVMGNAGNSVTFSEMSNDAGAAGGANHNNAMFDSPLGPLMDPSGGLDRDSANLSTGNDTPNMGSGMGSMQNISGGAGGSAPTRPVLSRSVSHNASMESYRQTIAEIISQIRKYDPYPCILGIPVMPALFNSSKFYIFIVFVLLGIRTMVACLRQI